MVNLQNIMKVYMIIRNCGLWKMDNRPNRSDETSHEKKPRTFRYEALHSPQEIETLQSGWVPFVTPPLPDPQSDHPRSEQENGRRLWDRSTRLIH